MQKGNESLGILVLKSILSPYVSILKKIGKLPYRKRSSAVVVDDRNNYLIVQLTKYGKDDWNFPGGGIEEGEKVETAVVRELEEELGVNKFEVIKMSKYKEIYDWPNWLIAADIVNKRKVYRGQEATFFLVRFLGNKKEIEIDKNELRKIKWVKLKDIQKHFNFDRQKGITNKISDLL